MILLTDEEIPFGVGKDNIAYHDAYLTGAKAQLKGVVAHLDTFNDKPVGEEVRLFIDRLRQALLEEVRNNGR